MTDQTLSVVVVSRHRAGALVRCLKGLLHQDHTATEVIVVADPLGLEAVRSLGVAVKVVPFDTPNISAARNAGLTLAAGAVVAFIDDDAVPEPTWASRLTAPFAGADVVAATGFIRGRNGISFQWRASEVDHLGQDHPLDVAMDRTTLHAGSAIRAVKTQGTNCAFRLNALRAIGGFDPAFRFFLDEADVNLRLAGHGATAIVPLAQVHHGYLASDRRRSDRVPLDLTEIAASTAVFLRRHAADAVQDGLARLMAEQRARAMRHMIAGRLEPRDVTRLMASLARGWAAGLARDLPHLSPMAPGTPAFEPLPGLGPRPGLVIAGRSGGQDDLRAKASEAVADGQIVTLLCMGAGWRRHQHRFDDAGFWIQTGGLWGRSVRDVAIRGRPTLSDRLNSEIQRIAAVRPIGGLTFDRGRL